MTLGGAAPAVLEIRVWGARGTLPGCGNNQRSFGTETCCVEMRPAGRRLIFDAGTGIVPLGHQMMLENAESADIFFSHVHYDHIIGLPFFKPLYRPGTAVSITAGHMLDGRTSAEIVEDFMRAPFLPIGPSIFAADVDYRSFTPGAVLRPADGIVVRTARLTHPNGAVGYRVEHGGRAVSYVTDTEHEPGRTDAAVVSLMQDADIVFYDATYTDAEMARFRGFGHSSWQEGLRLARATGVKRLVLFHHAHTRDDDALTRIEAEARCLFPGAIAARTGLTFFLPLGEGAEGEGAAAPAAETR